METLVTSVAGAEIAKRAFQALQRAGSGKMSGGPTLVLAARGAEAARGLMVKLPNAKLRALLQDALAGEAITPGEAPYSLLDTLLQGAASPSNVIQNFRRVNIYMWNAGYHGVNDAANEYIDKDFKQAGATAVKKGANPTAKSQIPDSGPAKSAGVDTSAEGSTIEE